MPCPAVHPSALDDWKSLPRTTSLLPLDSTMLFAWLGAALVASAAALRDAAPLHRRDVYIDDVLYHHNIHRRNHSAPDLQYHYGLSVAAQAIARTCYYEHVLNYGGIRYGQNIAAGIPWQEVGRVITDYWYNGEVASYMPHYYDPNPPFSKAWGHFTQMVWKDTSHVGCYTQHCPQGVANAPYTYDYTVCNYIAVGNVQGQYANNVGTPRGYPTVYGD